MSATPTGKHRSDWQRIGPFSLTVFFLISAYAIVRYNVFKGVDIEFIPLYILNKILALSSVVFIGISYLLGPIATKRELRRPFGLLGFACAGIHSLISIVLLTPYYYPAFYMGGKFTLFASIHLLFGMLSTALFTIVAVSSIPNIMQTTESSRWRSIQRIGYIALICVLIHVYTVGVNSWKDYSVWPGNMVPISLIAFSIIFFVLLVKLASLLFRRPPNVPIKLLGTALLVSVVLAGMLKFVRNENVFPRLKNTISGVDVADPFTDLPTYPRSTLVQSRIIQLRFTYTFENVWKSADNTEAIARWYADMLAPRGWTLSEPPSDWNAANLNLVFNKKWNRILALSITPSDNKQDNTILIQISTKHQQEDVLY